MPSDWPGDSPFDLVLDDGEFYGVPDDHPAFRRQDDPDEGDGSGGNTSEAGGDLLQLPVGRYDRYGHQVDGQGDGRGYDDSQEPSGVPRTGDTRPGATDRTGIRRQLEQRARDEGTRSIREHAVATEHIGRSEDGSGDSRADEEPSLRAQLAASLQQAGIALRDEWQQPGGTRSDTAALGSYVRSTEHVKEHGGPNKGWSGASGPVETVPLFVKANRVTKPPQFQRCVLRGQLGSLKSNSSGTWILTLAIDPDSYDEVMKMGSAHGLALDIVIGRKSRD